MGGYLQGLLNILKHRLNFMVSYAGLWFGCNRGACGVKEVLNKSSMSYVKFQVGKRGAGAWYLCGKMLVLLRQS